MTPKTTTFNKAAQKQDPAVFDYAREVKQVWRDFPEKKDKLYFLDLCAKEMLVYPGDAKRKEEIRQWMSAERIILPSAELFRTVLKGSGYMPSHGTMLLYTQENKYPFLDKKAFQAQETMFAFDHELGHAIIPNALPADGSENIAESIADAYAVVRHLQRYGAESSVIDALAGNRTFRFIFKKDMLHLTSPVVEKILARRYEIAWDSLTPAETTQLARRFALEYAVHPVLLDVIDKDFKKLQGKTDDIEKGDVSPLQELAEIVLSTEVSAVFKYGAVALKFCLDGQAADIILTGDYWDNVRRKLAEKQKIFAAQDKLLFGMGAKDRLLQRNVAGNVIKFKL